MIRTYDFLLYAQRNSEFMSQIQAAISSASSSILYTKIHKLEFSAQTECVIITSNTEQESIQNKIIPMEIKYQALLKMLAKDWDAIDPADIRFL